jgi:hypothetical protein
MFCSESGKPNQGQRHAEDKVSAKLIDCHGGSVDVIRRFSNTPRPGHPCPEHPY